MNFTIDRLPEMRTLSWTALRTIRRRAPAEVVLPEMSATLPGFRFDARNLADYREICGFEVDDSVPLSYPQVSAIGVQMYLLTRPQFPLPLLGLVHLANEIRQEAPLDPAAPHDVEVAVTVGKQTDRGLEFGLRTRYMTQAGDVPWEAKATVLFRNVKPPPRRPKAPAPPEPLAEYLTFEAATDIGRRYGRISGDMNPIHLTPWSAKLFGFKRHIAHGMWSLARCNALLDASLDGPAKASEIRFRQPLLLPARVSLRHRAVEGGREFSLLAQKDGRTHLTGTLR